MGAELSPIRQIIWFCWVLALASYLCAASISPEVFGHLTVGRWIVANGSLPAEDLWTEVGAGKAWFTPSWLFDVVLALLERWDLQRGVLGFKLVVYVVFVVGTSLLASGLTRSCFYGTLISSLLCAGLLANSPFGPEVIDWVTLIVTLLYVSGILRSRLLFAFLLVALLNLSQSGWMAIAATAALTLVVPTRRAITAIVVLFLGLVLSPYVGENVIETVRDSFERIAQSVPFFRFDYRHGFLVLLLALAVLVQKDRAGKLLFGLSMLLSGGALYFAPALPLAFIVTGLTIVLGSLPPKLNEGMERFQRLLAALHPAGVVWLLGCVVTVNAYRMPSDPAFYALVPVNAVDHLLKGGSLPRLLHRPEVGSYIAARSSDDRGHPHAKALYDHRLYQFDPVLSAAVDRADLELMQSRTDATHVLCLNLDPLCKDLERPWRQVYPEYGRGIYWTIWERRE